MARKSVEPQHTELPRVKSFIQAAFGRMMMQTRSPNRDRPNSVSLNTFFALLVFFGVTTLAPIGANAQYRLRDIAWTGDEAPGPGTTPLTFDGFDYWRAFYGGDGSIVFAAGALRDPEDVFGPFGYWIDDGDGLRLLAMEGEPVPGIPGAAFPGGQPNFLANIDESGNILVSTPVGSLPAPKQVFPGAILLNTPGGLQPLVQAGQASPLIDPVFGTLFLQSVDNSTFDPFHSDRVAFTSVLLDDQGNRAAKDGLFVQEQGQPLVALLHTRQSLMPGFDNYQALSLNATSDRAFELVMNASGQICLMVEGEKQPPSDYGLALYRSNGNTLEPLITSFSFIEGQHDLEARLLTINASGQVAFLGKVPGRAEEGVWIASGPGQVEIAFELGAALGMEGDVLNEITGLALTDAGNVVVKAIRADSAEGIWAQVDTPSGKEIQPVARAGDPAPGLPDGTTFGVGEAIGAMIVNATGQVCFTAAIAGDGVPFDSNGLWIGVPGAVDLVVSTLDEFVPLESGREVWVWRINFRKSPFSQLIAEGFDATAADGRATPFGEDGSVVFEISNGNDRVLVVASKGLIVNSTGNTDDDDLTDDECDTGLMTLDGQPECTLQAAIMQANATAGADRITFDIPTVDPGFDPATGWYTIQPNQALPTINDEVNIQGSTAEAIPLKRGPRDKAFLIPTIVLDGSGQAAGSGLTYGPLARRSALSYLTVIRFPNHGIETQADLLEVDGCYIGSTQLGQGGLGNGGSGVLLDGCEGARIGNKAAAGPNWISGNTRYGVEIIGDGLNNAVQGCVIGLGSPNGHALGNSMGGVFVAGGRVQIIGGLAETVGQFPGNVISANGTSGGVVLQGEKTRVLGNLIGTDITGSVTDPDGIPQSGDELGNQKGGIVILGAHNEIGNGLPTGRNVISGNLGNGVEIRGTSARENILQENWIGTNAAGDDSLANHSNGVAIIDSPANTIGDIGANLISGNRKAGVLIQGAAADSNVVQDNLIGITKNGAKALGNNDLGVYVRAADYNTIGGLGQGNTIAGNKFAGVWISANANYNTIAANDIGYAPVSNKAIPNLGPGIIMHGHRGRIGGSEPGHGNAILANQRNGIEVTGAQADSVVILHNTVGSVGDFVAGNLGQGIILTDASNAAVGWDPETGDNEQFAPNTIVANAGSGISIIGESARNNLITGNYIGTNASGEEGLGNAGHGVNVEQASLTTIENAWIAGNQNHGVFFDASADTNTVALCFIGVAEDGSALGNVWNGIQLRSVDNTISQNLISANKLGGIDVFGPLAKRNTITFNDIGVNTDGDCGQTPTDDRCPFGNQFFGIRIHNGASDNLIENNLISGNAGDGVLVRTEFGNDPAQHNEISENTIGLGRGLNRAVGNEWSGVSIVNSRLNYVWENTLSGNKFNGLQIFGALADSNTVQANKIGTNPPGTTAFGNRKRGIEIIGAPRNTIGGLEPGDGNVISGNGFAGVYITKQSARDNTVLGNLIGLFSDAASSRAPNFRGVVIDGAPHNLIGGAAEGARNVISGNEEHGILVTNARADSNAVLGNYVGLAPNGTAARANKWGITLNNSASFSRVGGGIPGDPNVVSGNTRTGIVISDAPHSFVVGNLVGTNADGDVAVGNGIDGIVLSDGTTRSQIGAAQPSASNTISGNGRHGVLIKGIGTMANLVLGNRIGTDKSGTQDLGNQGSGVVVSGSSVIRIGHPISGGRNVIAGNQGDGIHVKNDAIDCSLKNNYIGLREDGAPLGNTGNGIVVEDGNGILIGGAEDGARNTISANGQRGIVIRKRDSRSYKNVIEGNYIGTDPSGTVSDPDGIPLSGDEYGNVLDGIYVSNAEQTRIGGTQPTLNQCNGPCNVIGGNGGDGINITEGGQNKVYGNYIGAGIGLVGLPNAGHGVYIGSSDKNKVGNGSSTRNTIAHHDNANRAGVYVEDANNTKVLNNIIRDNDRGVTLDNADYSRITNNVIAMNQCGVEISFSSFFNTTLNKLNGNTNDQCTGIHLYESSGIISGNFVSDDAGNGITLEDGSTADVFDNAIQDNQGFGLENLDPSQTIAAQGNWWGSSDGPSGVGPGSGDEVSSNVDFANWLTSSVSLVVATAYDSIYVQPGTEEFTYLHLRNWAVPDDDVEVSFSDDLGWLTSPSPIVAALDPEFGGEALVAFDVPAASTSKAAVNVIRAEATSLSDPSDIRNDSFVVIAYDPVLSQIDVVPDSVRVATGDSTLLRAAGFDQMGRELEFTVQWSSPGGTAFQDGWFVAGQTMGFFEVIATDDDQVVQGIGVVEIVDPSVGLGDQGDQEDEEATVEPQAQIPSVLTLQPNFPNPFNPRTIIRFGLPKESRVTLEIFDMRGRRVAALIPGDQLPAGFHSVVWEGVDDRGHEVASGVYLYRLRTQREARVQRMVLLR